MNSTKKKKTTKKTLHRSADSKALRRTFALRRIFEQPNIEIDYVYRLLAFGALASNALANDTTNTSVAGATIANAANAYRSSTAATFTATAKAYLIDLGFAQDFVNNVMPWTMISQSGINTMGQILEPDDDDYDDGGCFNALEASLSAIEGMQ